MKSLTSSYLLIAQDECIIYNPVFSQGWGAAARIVISYILYYFYSYSFIQMLEDGVVWGRHLSIYDLQRHTTLLIFAFYFFDCLWEGRPAKMMVGETLQAGHMAL